MLGDLSNFCSPTIIFCSSGQLLQTGDRELVVLYEDAGLTAKDLVFVADLGFFSIDMPFPFLSNVAFVVVALFVFFTADFFVLMPKIDFFCALLSSSMFEDNDVAFFKFDLWQMDRIVSSSKWLFY